MSEELNGSIKVGKIKDAHGLKGEVYFISFSGDISYFETTDQLLLEEVEGQLKSYEIINFKPFKEGAIIKIKGVENRNQSELLKGKMVYVESKHLTSDPGETIYLREIQNFEVYNPEGKNLGVIDAFYSNGAQDILIIKAGDLSYEVPLVDDFIVEIQFEKKTIVMDFPEDLMEINKE